MDAQRINTLRKVEMPTGFLSLAPATSGGTKAVAEGIAKPAVRRSSSLSSERSNKSYKILKLNPVHLGEHADDHKGDWHEIAVVG